VVEHQVRQGNLMGTKQSTFTCSICDAKFARGNLLNAHLVASHAVRPGIPDSLMIVGWNPHEEAFHCVEHNQEYVGFQAARHYREQHNNARVQCLYCDVTKKMFVPTATDLLNATNEHTWLQSVVRPHLETHFMVVKDEWPVVVTSVHSAAYTPVTQEFYELAAMRGQSLLVVAMDLIEEYIVSNGSDWDNIMTYIQDVLRNRASVPPVMGESPF
jgi:hypothetical protein